MTTEITEIQLVEQSEAAVAEMRSMIASGAIARGAYTELRARALNAHTVGAMASRVSGGGYDDREAKRRAGAAYMGALELDSLAKSLGW